MPALLLAVATAHADQPHDGPAATRVGVFYDAKQPANFLWPYTFRVLVVEDLVGSGWQCWVTYPNGTTAMDPGRCRPVSGLKLRIWYAELREAVEVVTDENGEASVVWRLFSYPQATFRVEARVGEDLVVREFHTYPQVWSLAAVTAFAGMLSMMVVVVRRGVW